MIKSTLILDSYNKYDKKTRRFHRNPWFALSFVFCSLVFFQLFFIHNWNVDYESYILGYINVRDTHAIIRRELPVAEAKVKPSQCQPSFAPNPVHVGGSSPSSQYKDFDFSSPPGSESRLVQTFSYQLSEEEADKARITIITPTNNPKFLDATANSIFAQSFNQFKWIIVNDHSDELFTLNRYKYHKDKRVSVIDCSPDETKHCGPAKARNQALRMVNSEFVIFLDDDDLIEPTYLEKLIWFLISNAEFSYVNSYSVSFGAKNSLWDRTFYQSSMSENQQVITALLRTSSLQTISEEWPKVFDEEMTKGGSGGSEDWKMWLKLKDNELHGATIPEYLFWYRIKEKRRNWEFLTTSLKQRNLRGSTKEHENFGATAAAKIFPKLYENGHVNPTIDDCSGTDGALSKHCQKAVVDFENMPMDLTVSKPTPKCKPVRHIVLVIPWMALGGSDMVNVKLVRLLAENNWKVTIVNTLSTSSKSSTSSSLEFFRPILQQYTEDIFTLPHFVRVKDYHSFFLYLLKSRKADVMMMSNSYAGYNLLPYLKTHAPNVVFADYVHMRQLSWKIGAYFEDQKEMQVGGFPRLSGLFEKYLDLSLFVSDDERKWVSKMLPQPSNSQQVVHYGVNMERYQFSESERSQSRKRFGISDDTMSIVFVGRLVEQKRPEVLIKIFHQLKEQIETKKQGTKVHLIVAGDGELQNKLESYIQQYNLHKDVSMLGRVDREDIPSVLAAGDVIFLPSKMEGLAVALIEAMSTGLVPVVTDVGGHREIVLPGSGCLLDRDDEEGMLQCLVNLALNPEMRNKMSQKAQAIVKQDFSFESMKRDVENHLSEAIEKNKLEDGQNNNDKEIAEIDLPKALQAIRKMDPALSTLTAALNMKNVPKRKTEFGRSLSKLCGEDAGIMTKWISMMEASRMCGSSNQAAEVIGKHIQRQCGQWCIFDTNKPDKLGWAFNGQCFTEFDNDEHFCHKYTNLKDKLKNF